MTRLEQIARELPKPAGAAIVTGRFNLRYLTGLRSSAGTLIIAPKGSGLIIDSRYHELAVGTVKDCEIILQDKLYDQIAGLLKKYGGVDTVALDSENCNLKTRNAYREKLEGVTLLEDDRFGELIGRMRAVKNKEEISKIYAAQKIAEKTFDHILGFIKPGLTEREIALEAEVYGKTIGAQDTAFSVIVAGGSNSSMPHAVPGDKKVNAGEFLLIDMGFMVDGYCSDMTRTVAIGHASRKQKDVYNTALSAQQAALEKIKPGVLCKDVDAAARGIIDASPYTGLFGHGLGHSLGLEVHETPAFNKINETPLQPGMVMTVEPGIYIPGEFGVRIEDLIAVTEDGFENLTASPKNLIVL